MKFSIEVVVVLLIAAACGEERNPESLQQEIIRRRAAVEDSLATMFSARQDWAVDIPEAAWLNTYTIYFQRALVLHGQPIVTTGELLDVRLAKDGYRLFLDADIATSSLVSVYFDLKCSVEEANALLRAVRNKSGIIDEVSVAVKVDDVVRPPLTFAEDIEPDDVPYAVIEPEEGDFVIGRGDLLGFGIVR